MDKIKYWIEREGAGHWFFVAFPVILLLLFIWFKGRKIRFLIPSLLISIVIVNPWFYAIWNDLGLYAYWRILWVLPVIPVVAAIIPAVTERLKKEWMKGAAVAIGVGLIILGGTFAYSGEKGAFVTVANAAKIPDYVVRIADRLLELKDNPRVIVEDPIGVYLRQYTGEIYQMYGRDIDGFIYSASNMAQTVHAQIEDPMNDLSNVSQIMLDEGYDYLVTSIDRRTDRLEMVDRIGDYRIYKAVGIPTVKKERNQLGQIAAYTVLDLEGQPANGENGYSTLHRDYDSYGNITYEFYTDVDGAGVPDGNGRAGFERTYDSQSRVIMERNLGTDGKATVSKLGYAEVRWVFDGDKLLSESFRDENGLPVNGINGYAAETRTYERGLLISQRFSDTEGNPTVTASGYAEKKCTYSNGKLVKEEYYGADGGPVTLSAGYASIQQTWDGNRLESRIYLDGSGKPVTRTDGYSEVRWFADKNGTSQVSFYGAGGDKIGASGLNLVKDLSFGEDGWSEWIIPDNNVSNYGVYVGTAILDEKKAGDIYSCQIEIEFQDVTGTQGETFRFCTQGTADDSWKIGNPWNRFVWITKVPADGVYRYSTSCVLDQDMANASEFLIGFRCDNWGSGRFRVRNVKIEKGDTPGKWTPGI